MKYRSALQSRVEQLGMTFTFNHICCRTIEVDGSLMEYPEDLWFVSISFAEKSFSNEFKTGMGHRILNPMVSQEKGRFFYKSGAGTLFNNEAELIRAGLLNLPNAVGSSEQKKERMFNLGVDFLNCVLSDASGAENSFKEWASDYGYSDDSIKALNIYRQYQEIRSELLRFLGMELFQELAGLEH